MERIWMHLCHPCLLLPPPQVCHFCHVYKYSCHIGTCKDCGCEKSS